MKARKIEIASHIIGQIYMNWVTQENKIFSAQGQLSSLPNVKTYYIHKIFRWQFKLYNISYFICQGGISSVINRDLG